MLKFEYHHLQTSAYVMLRRKARGEGLSAGMPAALLIVRMSGLISTAYTTTGISRRIKRSCGAAHHVMRMSGTLQQPKQPNMQSHTISSGQSAFEALSGCS